MKIGLVSAHSLSSPGGVQAQVRLLLKGLLERGHKAKIISPRQNGENNFGKEILWVGRSITVSFNAGQGALSFSLKPRAIPRLLAAESFDILHYHNLGLFLPLQILSSSQTTNILTQHSFSEGSVLWRSTPEAERFARALFVNKMDGVIGVSSPVLEILGEGFKKPVKIIPNAIDLERFSPAATLVKKLPSQRINILFVGRVEERKGLIYLLRAFARLRKRFENTSLTVVGEGPLKSEAEGWVKRYRIRGIDFTGYVKDKDLPPYYKRADVFCSPATHGESFGVVLLEAMASGAPIVCFANTGYREVMRNYPFTEGLVPPRDIGGLTRALEILVKNKTLREELSRWGLKEVQQYSSDKITQQVVDFYEEVSYH